VQYFDMKDKLFDHKGTELHLVIYFVIYPNNSTFLRNRLIKLCDSFSQTLNMDRFDIARTKLDLEKQFS
jgi:hypothetical protein